MSNIVFFTIDVGDEDPPKLGDDLSQPRTARALQSTPVRSKMSSTSPSPVKRPSTVPAYVRLYEMAAVLRAKRYDAHKRAEAYRILRESVELRTNTIHKRKASPAVYERMHMARIGTPRGGSEPKPS